MTMLLDVDAIRAAHKRIDRTEPPSAFEPFPGITVIPSIASSSRTRRRTASPS